MDEFLKVVEIPEDVVIYIEKLCYDAEAYRNIMNSVLRDNKYRFNHNVEIYDKFMKEYKNANREYRVALNSLLETYANEYIGYNVETNLNFITCQFTVQEKGSCCNNG